MSSCDYWLEQDHLCPACRRGDHAHCDPDRMDDPSRDCECQQELLGAVLPQQREASE